MTIQSRIIADIAQAMKALQHSGIWPSVLLPTPEVSAPSEKQFGDFSTTVAMVCAYSLGKSPLQVAQDIKGALTEPYTQVQIAQPGFLNFMLSDEQWVKLLGDIAALGDAYGQQKRIGPKQKVVVESLSALPVAPLTLLDARGVYVGDVIANVLQALGYKVVRECSVNDRGKHIDVLGESVMRTYLQQHGLNVPYTDDLYQGEYIEALAKKVDMSAFEHASMQQMNAMRDSVTKEALSLLCAERKNVLAEKMHVKYDSWIGAQKLVDRGIATKMLKRLEKQEAVYEVEGALWAKTTQYGDDKDRVLRRVGVEVGDMHTDFALWYERAIERKVDTVITILPADHRSYEKRLKAIPQLLGVEIPHTILFVQMTKLMHAGKEVRMSKGMSVTIEELIDEVGSDRARFFSLLSPIDSYLSVDVKAMTEESERNPFYVMSDGYARMSSILEEAKTLPRDTVTHPESVLEAVEKTVLGKLSEFPSLLEQVGQTYEVHRLIEYALSIVEAMEACVAQCPVVEEGKVNTFRADLLKTTQSVLMNALRIVGIEMSK